jgi:hypothetical protein
MERFLFCFIIIASCKSNPLTISLKDDTVNQKKNTIKTYISNNTFNINSDSLNENISQDCSIINDKDSFDCLKLYISYYPNKKVKEKGCQGMYHGMGTPVGTWFKYDSVGNLKQTIYYHPDEFGKDYKIVYKYKKGKQISKTIFNNDEQYETPQRRLNKIP